MRIYRPEYRYRHWDADGVGFQSTARVRKNGMVVMGDSYSDIARFRAEMLLDDPKCFDAPIRSAPSSPTRDWKRNYGYQIRSQEEASPSSSKAKSQEGEEALITASFIIVAFVVGVSIGIQPTRLFDA